MKKERNSSIEILRILAMLGIVIMHTNGAVMEHGSGTGFVWTQIENGIFNAGVSIFVLISGYFGIRRSAQKLIELELTVILYAVLSALVGYYLGKVSILNIIKAFIPISTNCYWFISCYILLMIFSPYINKAIDSMSELQHRQLLLLMSAVFLVAPTVIYYSVLSGGKNVINMLLLYFLGSYIRKYNLSERYDKKFLLKILIATMVLNVFLNSLISIATGGKPHIPFARDCSIFIVIEAVTLMMFFMKVELHSDFINRIAKHVFAVYLFEGAFRKIMQKVIFDYSIYEGEWCWPLVNIVIALIAMVGCMSIDVLAQWTLRPFRKAALKMLGGIINISQKIFIYYQQVTFAKSISSDNKLD